MTIWQRLRPFRTRIALLLAVVGPGIITANVDNDAGGIATYSVAGAHFGYSLLWTLIPITIALVVVQEMVARMGVVTGKTLGDLIRENLGVKATFYLMLCLIFADLGNTVAEFAGSKAQRDTITLCYHHGAGGGGEITRGLSITLAPAQCIWLMCTCPATFTGETRTRTFSRR
jgi:Mn2+/Fe2+ NRAMP family transporter